METAELRLQGSLSGLEEAVPEVDERAASHVLQGSCRMLSYPRKDCRSQIG